MSTPNKETQSIIDGCYHAGCENADQVVGMLARRLHDMTEILTILLDDLDSLIDHSDGVTGLHLNGNVARWSEVDESGTYERLTNRRQARDFVDSLVNPLGKEAA